MKNGRPKILASILNYRSADDTISCAQAVLSLPYSPSELIIIDNASGDDSVARIRSAFPSIHLIESYRNHGYAGGHQLGVDYAFANNCDALWILNPDLDIHPQVLEALVKAWQEKETGIFGSISLESPEVDTIIFAGANELEGGKEVSDYNPWKGRNFKGVPEAQRMRNVSAIEGFSMLIPLEIIRQHGFMDHRYFMYGEETIWCYDLRKCGVPVYIVPGSIVYHYGYGSLGEEMETSPVATYYRMRNAIYWKRKHYNLKRWEILKRKGGPFAFLKFFLKYVFKGHKWRNANRKSFFENLAIIHAFLGIKGRRVV